MATVVAQPQTSRAGLITTIVISLIINILLAVVYFTKYNDYNKLEADSKNDARKYADIVAASALPEVTALKEQAKNAGSATVYDMLTTQRNDLATSIIGNPQMPPQEVRDRATAALKENNDALDKYGQKVELKVAPGNNLLEALSRWPGVVQKAIDRREQLSNDLTAAKQAKDAADAANVQALAEKDKAIADAKAETAKANDQITQLQQAQSKALADVKADSDQKLQSQAQQLAAVTAAVAQKDQTISDKDKKVVKLISAIRRFKANPATKEDTVRVADGEIKTVAGNQCFINLGQGDHISVGMTFEVYDLNKGIPPLGDGVSNPEPSPRTGSAASALATSKGKGEEKYEFELPKGKGSIEVINVGPDHTSQCRIIHTEPGQTLSQGDLIANLVYDRNLKFKFIAYGDFDLANSNGNGRSNDIRVIRRLIEEWGGQVQPIVDPAHPGDSVTPETDFVIIGKEPVVPNYGPDELSNPSSVLAIENAKARLAAYRAVLNNAADYGIPVMNQNRFLYYTGYFDQARR